MVYVFNHLVWPAKDVIKIEMALVKEKDPPPLTQSDSSYDRKEE